MEVYTQLREIVKSYNDCIKNIMYINEMMMPRMEEKQPSQHQPIGPCPDPVDMCYDCQMQQFGETLLKAIKAHFPSENNDIKPESINEDDSKDPYARIELMMYQARHKDEMIQGLMKEVALLRQENSKLMCQINERISESGNLKRDLAILHNQIGQLKATEILKTSLQN